MDAKLVEAGQIVNTHGIAGEVKIQVWLDSAELMKKCKRYFVDGKEMRVLSSRVHKGFLIAKIEGVEDMNCAERLKNKTVLVPKEDVPIGEDRVFVQDILGFDVVNEDGTALGTLTEVMESPAALIYVVKGESEHLIPAIPEFIMSTDVNNRTIRVRLIKGM